MSYSVTQSSSCLSGGFISNGKNVPCRQGGRLNVLQGKSGIDPNSAFRACTASFAESSKRPDGANGGKGLLRKPLLSAGSRQESRNTRNFQSTVSNAPFRRNPHRSRLNVLESDRQVLLNVCRNDREYRAFMALRVIPEDLSKK